MTILVTGSAGFIGFHVSKALLNRGDIVIGIDNFNSYYDPKLKEARNAILEKYQNYKLYRIDITDQQALNEVFAHSFPPFTKGGTQGGFVVCHLAAQAGVRYSLEHPGEYAKSNYEGTTNVFEAARTYGIKNLVVASSSSVYGNSSIPWSDNDTPNEHLDQPINPYAASKRATELLAYTYHHLYGLNITLLRFFTVYGPFGRPDMAYFTFADKITKDEEITVRKHQRSQVKRDFTYVDDVVAGILSALDKPQPYIIYNLGNHKPEDLEKLIVLLEKYLGKTANKKFEPLLPGEFLENFADIEKAKRDLGFEPKTRLEEGIKKFVAWYKEYYGL